MHLDDMDDERTVYDNVTFSVETPEGKATIIIVEEKPGVIHKILFMIGKAGSINNAWAFALAEMVVSNLHRGASLTDVIGDLSNITSSRPVFDRSGIPCRSGPEALYLVLMRYRNMYKDAPVKRVTYNEDYRAPKLGKNL